MRKLVQNLWYVVVLICISTSLAFAQEEASSDTTKKYKPVVYPSGFIANLDEVYVTVGNWKGRMDVYFQPKATAPTPLLINIHGGGWKNGVKETQGGFSPFFKDGFSVANVEYRMSPQAKAPAAVEDVRCALIYLIKNAKQFNIDPNKIVVMGSSAGGHLALMTGYLGNNHLFDSNCADVKDVKVAAVIDKYGCTDVWAKMYNNYGPSVRKNYNGKEWLGEKKNDEAFAKSVSPVSYVNKNTVPTFIIHGNADSSIAYNQSEVLYQLLTENGVKTSFITVDGGGHGKFPKEKNDELTKAILKFIHELAPFKQ
jgi:acetyl esterase/lipase